MTELSPLDQGRMIAALRQVKAQKYGRHPRYRYLTYERHPRYTDEQIREALHLTKPQFKKGVATYEAARPRRWTRNEMAEKVLSFAVTHKRWPTSKEMTAPMHQRLDLPPRSTVTDMFQGSLRQSSSASLVRFIVQNEKMWKRMTPELILAIRNVTIRREAMEKYGVEKLLRKGGGTLHQKDDYGKLWRLPSDNQTDKHAQWVEVVNATKEPDGTYAHFFLRVPPDMETARAAVAWTFDVRGEQQFEVKAAA